MQCSVVQCIASAVWCSGVQGRPLASLSASLYASHSVPRIDTFKTVILLEEISVSQIIFLNKIIFDQQQTGGTVQGLDPE